MFILLVIFSNGLRCFMSLWPWGWGALEAGVGRPGGWGGAPCAAAPQAASVTRLASEVGVRVGMDVTA